MFPLTLILLLLAPASPPDRHLITAVPFIPQRRNRCGPAALAMVFHYYRVPIKAEDLAREIYQKDLSGTLNLDLLVAARRHGFTARAQSGDLKTVKDFIRREVPVIALVRPRSGSKQYHFLVICGFDDGDRQLTVHSGRRRGEKISYPAFRRQWRSGRNWMLTVERRRE